MLKNGLYNLTGKGLSLLIGIISTPILIQTLGLENYGLWILVSSTLVLIGIAEGGLASTSLYFVSKDLKDDISKLQTSILVISVGMILLSFTALVACYFLAPIISNQFQNINSSQESIITLGLRIGGIVVWGRMLQGVIAGFEQAFDKYAIYNVSNTVQRLANNVSILFVASLTKDIIRIIQTQALITILFLIFHILFTFSLLKGIHFFPMNIKKIETTRIKEILNYSFSIWITTIGSAVFSQLDKVLIGGVLGVKSLGVYAAITSISSTINNISGTVSQPILPKVSGLDIKLHKDKIKAVDYFIKGCHINYRITILISVFILFLSPEICKIILPKEYNVTYVYLFIACILIYCLYSLNSFSYYFLLGIKKEAFVMKVVISTSIATVVLIYISAIYYGIIGAIIGNIGFIGISILTIRGIAFLKINPMIYLKSNMKSIVILAISVLSCFLLTSLGSIYIRLIILGSILLLEGLDAIRFFTKRSETLQNK